MKERKGRGSSFPNVIRVAIATGAIATPLWACNPSEDTLPEPTPIATGTPIPPRLDTTLVFETPTAELMPKPEPTSSRPTPTESQFGFWLVGNVIVEIDKEGLPVNYVLPDGKKFSLEKEKMQQLRQIATRTKTPEIIAVTPSTLVPHRAEAIMRGLRGVPKDALGHPTLSELPKDVLSQEELAERGIRIIQADNTSLHIRQTAFDKDGLLASFNNKDDKELTVVLINAPTVSRVFMKDPKYGDVRGLVSEKYDQYMQTWVQSEVPSHIAFAEQFVDRTKKENQQLLDSGREMSDQEREKIQKAVNDTLIYKAMVFAFENGMFTKEQLLSYALSNSGVKAFDAKDHEGNPVVFLAVGNIDLSPFYMQVLYFDSKGDFKIKPELVTPPLPGIYPESFLSPKDGQSYPNPTDIPGLLPPLLTPTSSQPPYPAGVNLRLKLDKNNWNLAGERLQEAWNKWINSGYKDNSGYPFVFSLPEGGYILTKNESSSDSSTVL